MIAVTGDLVDGSVPQLSAHTAPLAGLTARHGAYFVTGNHEYYSGERAWTEEIRRLGLRVLKNEHVVLKHDGASLVIAGVTDISAHHFDPAQRSDPAAALRGAPIDAGARILLAHQPSSAMAAANAGFDVQISGHTHGGQFWPWNLFMHFFQPFSSGLHRLEEFVDLRKPRHRLLGSAQSLRRSIGDYADSVGSRGVVTRGRRDARLNAAKNRAFGGTLHDPLPPFTTFEPPAAAGWVLSNRIAWRTPRSAAASRTSSPRGRRCVQWELTGQKSIQHIEADVPPRRAH